MIKALTSCTLHGYVGLSRLQQLRTQAEQPLPEFVAVPQALDDYVEEAVVFPCLILQTRGCHVRHGRAPAGRSSLLVGAQVLLGFLIHQACLHAHTQGNQQQCAAHTSYTCTVHAGEAFLRLALQISLCINLNMQVG